MPLIVLVSNTRRCKPLSYSPCKDKFRCDQRPEHHSNPLPESDSSSGWRYVWVDRCPCADDHCQHAAPYDAEEGSLPRGRHCIRRGCRIFVSSIWGWKRLRIPEEEQEKREKQHYREYEGTSWVQQHVYSGFYLPASDYLSSDAFVRKRGILLCIEWR